MSQHSKHLIPKDLDEQFYVNEGKEAYLHLVSLERNPYRQHDNRLKHLWEKGWRAQYQTSSSRTVETGRASYRMIVPLQNNPYKINGKPWSDLWEKGWRMERRKWEGPPAQVFAPKPQIVAVARPTAADAQRKKFNRPPRPVDAKPTPTQPNVFQRKPPQRAEVGPGVFDTQRLNTFNQRHRTAA